MSKKHLHKLNQHRFTLLTSATLAGLFFVYNVKSYILTVIVFTLLTYLFTQFTLTQTIFTTLILTSFFEKGLRGWNITVVDPGIYSWMSGYSYYFGITLRLIFTLTLILLSIRLKIKTNKATSTAILFFLVASLSTLFNHPNTHSLLGLTRLATAFTLFFLANHYFKTQKLKKNFISITTLTLLFFGVVGTMQLLHQRSIGLFLEDTAIGVFSGYFTTDGTPLFRVSGLTGHPTFFASLMSLLLPISLTQYLSHLRHPNLLYRYLPLVASTLGTIAVFATFSRSGWISLLITAILILNRLFKNHTLKYRQFLLPLVLVVGLVSTFYGPMLIARLNSFQDFWTIGNGRGRLNLLRQSWLSTTQFPLLGVGLNRFTDVMVRRDLSPEVRQFLFPVHNTFALFFSELGLPAGLLFTYFVLTTIIQSYKKAHRNWTTYGVWIGAATFIFNAQFHTLFNQDPTFDIFMILLGYLSTL